MVQGVAFLMQLLWDPVVVATSPTPWPLPGSFPAAAADAIPRQHHSHLLTLMLLRSS
jgi:hypothetical protein